MKVVIKPITLRAANAYVEAHHRHHRAARGHKFSIAIYGDDGTLHGVAIAGRPVNRVLDDGETIEVLRMCTDGTYNACSMLYSRCARIAKDMGYLKIVTYILAEELGTSLKASGWELEEENIGGNSWENCTRRSDDRQFVQMSLFDERPKYPTTKKKRYGKWLGGVR